MLVILSPCNSLFLLSLNLCVNIFYLMVRGWVMHFFKDDVFVKVLKLYRTRKSRYSIMKRN